ncbi:MAG: LysR family transcriptional regulator, partial [Planctomycetota bacterium]
VAEHGNVTRAAATLHATQPAVSMQIKSLEQSLGLELFHRIPNGMKLTEAGKKLLIEARQTVAQADSTVDLARRLNDKSASSLHVGLNDTGVMVRLDLIISNLLHEMPGLTLQIDHHNSGIVLDKIRKIELDVGFYEGTIRDRSIDALRLMEIDLCIILPNKWADTPDWESLSRLPWVFTSPHCSYYKEMLRLSKEHSVELTHQFGTEHKPLVTQLVREGMAVSLVDRNTAIPEVEAGKLSIWRYYAGSVTWSLIALVRRLHEPAIETFRMSVASAYRASRMTKHEIINST